MALPFAANLVSIFSGYVGGSNDRIHAAIWTNFSCAFLAEVLSCETLPHGFQNANFRLPAPVTPVVLNCSIFSVMQLMAKGKEPQMSCIFRNQAIKLFH